MTSHAPGAPALGLSQSAAAIAARSRDEALRLGHDVRGSVVLGLLAGDVRPEMVAALDRVRAAGYKTACLTNNIAGGDGTTSSLDPSAGRSQQVAAIMDRFDAVVESSKVGLRKPQTADTDEAVRRIRGMLERATRDLGRVNYGTLKGEIRAQYESVKRFIEQAEEALRSKNLDIASFLADKAQTLAHELFGQ